MRDATGELADESAGGPLSGDELRTLSRLLARFAEHDLDQFELWTLCKPGYGDTYIYFGLNPLPGGTGVEAYTRIWPLPAHLADGQAPLLA